MGLELENILCQEALDNLNSLKQDSTTWDELKLWGRKYLPLHIKTSFKHSEKLRLPITINDDEEDLKDYSFINEFTTTMGMLTSFAEVKIHETDSLNAIREFNTFQIIKYSKTFIKVWLRKYAKLYQVLKKLRCEKYGEDPFWLNYFVFKSVSNNIAIRFYRLYFDQLTISKIKHYHRN